MMRRVCAILAAVTALVAATAPETRADVPPGIVVEDTRVVGRVIGPTSPAATDVRWNVVGADMGSMFEHDGRVFMIFGDTYGAPQERDLTQRSFDPDHPNDQADWRSQTMGWFDNVTPGRAPNLDGMIEDRPFHAMELVPSLKDRTIEGTVIFDNAIDVDGRMVAHYLSVKDFSCDASCPLGKWANNGAGLAWSDDDGQTWTKGPLLWGPDSGFGLVAFAAVDRYVYLVGAPSGRFGDLRLGRVHGNDILDARAYRYWDGESWSKDEMDAAPIVTGPVGEVSVQWSPYHRRWLLATTSDGVTFPGVQHGVQLRWAPCLTGPWSDPQLLVGSTVLPNDGAATRVPAPYAGYLTPTGLDGPEVRLAVSDSTTYGVYWVETALQGLGDGDHESRCIEP